MSLFLADAGIPMLFFHLPAMALALVPVVTTEWLVACRQLNLPWKMAFKGVVVANLFSTLLGFPLFWLVGVVFLVVLGTQFPPAEGAVGRIADFTAGMFWLGPEARIPEVVCSGLAMMVPAFFVSVFSERWILRSAWPDVSPAALARFSWITHLFSYPALITVWLAYVLQREW